MFKKLIAVLLMACLVLALTGCSDIQQLARDEIDNVDNNQASDETLYDEDEEDVDTDTSSSEELEEYNGVLGEEMSTVFFDFTVLECTESMDYKGDLPELAGSTPAEGNKFVNVTFEITNEEINMDLGDGVEGLPMVDNDFRIFTDVLDDAIASNGANEVEWKSNEWVMAVGETMTKTLVFEVPQETEIVEFVYLEVYADDEIGAAHRVMLDVE